MYISRRKIFKKYIESALVECSDLNNHIQTSTIVIFVTDELVTWKIIEAPQKILKLVKCVWNRSVRNFYFQNFLGTEARTEIQANSRKISKNFVNTISYPFWNLNLIWSLNFYLKNYNDFISMTMHPTDLCTINPFKLSIYSQ